MRQRTNAPSLRYPVLLAAVLALGACGGEREATDASDADIAAQADDAAGTESADVATPEADIDTGTLPEWFPEDVYLPEEYSVVGAMDVGDVRRLELQVDGSVADVAAQAAAYMQDNGWGDGTGTGETMGYMQGDRSAMLTINERDDGTVRVGYQFTTL